MKRIYFSIAFFITFCLLLSFQKGKIVILKIPQNWEQPNYNFKNNQLNYNTIQLGRALFYDPILSKDSSISCSSCHSVYNAFTHVDHPQSHGIKDRKGKRNSPTLMNLAWQKSFMWDGAVSNLDAQGLLPISHPSEMDEKIENVVLKLNHSKRYKKLAFAAYHDSTFTGERTLKALSQFLLTLISSDSKYDSVLRKQSKFTIQEVRGYEIFKRNCSNCHKEPLFTNLEYENNGLPIDSSLKDYGRVTVTLQKEDSLKFKVPTLRNIEFSYPYMHDGRFSSLREVLNHYTIGIKNQKKISTKLSQPINLTSNEKVDLISFLLTLSDKKFIFNKDFSYPFETLKIKTRD